jgi:hypothetical protein
VGDFAGLAPAPTRKGTAMAKGQLRSNKEAKKPKKEKPKVLATAGLTSSSTAAAASKKK